tara:strand:+ start:243 stop:863 length:621 start_codon:yes stop_codon:yes gene_type:complete
METQLKEKKNLLDIIKSNWKIISGLIFFILILISVYSWFELKSDIKKKNLSEDYIKAKILISQKKDSDALNILESIINKKDNTYSVLSLNLIIDQELEKNNQKIIDYFDKVLSIGNLKNEELDLVKFKKAVYISNQNNEKELLSLLNPIINSESVWKAQSTKFLADYYFSKKEYSKADQYYSILLAMENPNIDDKEIKKKIQTYKK